ncbi:Pvc16 family protein [Falsihalocynthiibacter arcticus]|uniref:Pvc16 N-terminal domain-containing protein n=1 Tax=Falsihalocynthiibacter arcticus TaxID=1579316 RepID=A0A126V192_9RHOB|nr:Pvc16 family protein [Falsihalocynthiibacter arcticus]AML51927.1 hypothetical protein RC74_12205 [Falsihalocynthiibacter arcticus]
MAGAAHIAEVMNAVRQRILTLRDMFEPITLAVEIANPAQKHPRAADADAHLVTLFLYRIEPDHTAFLASPKNGMAVRLKVMITAYGGQMDGVLESIGTLEMRILSHIMRLFIEAPDIGPIRVPETLPIGPMAGFVTNGVAVQAQQLSLDMEEVNHIWTTQGDTPFRTSLVYSFNYALVTPLTPSDEGPPVLMTNSSATPDYDPNPAPPLVNMGALAFRVTTLGQPKLLPTTTVLVGGGNIDLALLLVTESPETFDLVIEQLDTATGIWGATAGTPAQIVSFAYEALNPAAVPAGTPVSIPNPAAAAVFKLSVRHPVDPDDYEIGPVTLVVEAAP